MNVVTKAIEELVEQIRVRQQAVKALQAVSETPGALPAPAARPAAPARPPDNRPKARPQPVVVAPPTRCLGRQTNPSVVEACRKLAEPFGVSELAAAAGLTLAGASSAVYRWADRGWLNKVSPGKWTRTEGLGLSAAAPAAPGARQNAPVTVPPPAPAVADLEEQIRDLRAECDLARGKGRDRIAQVYQDKINHMQKQLEAAKA